MLKVCYALTIILFLGSWFVKPSRARHRLEILIAILVVISFVGILHGLM